MTKKKKLYFDNLKQNKTNDIIDNKDHRSQNEDSFETNIGVASENPQTEEEQADPIKVEDVAAEVSDKDVKEILSSEEKLAEMQDRYLRLSAEFDNYRKRTLREKMELTKHAGENILISIVPVMDDFERALKLMETATDCVAMKSGIDLIYNKFSEFLKQNGLKEIEAINQSFNVDLHEAVTKLSVRDESMKGKVVEVIEKGYWLHDKVMRFAKVVVGE
ncbi:MAG: nucleotide exchange factor GrpE [Odoribacter sp.]|nr:nucleotide exchange factor GrpE [Odoribacter sp.]